VIGTGGLVDADALDRTETLDSTGARSVVTGFSLDAQPPFWFHPRQVGVRRYTMKSRSIFAFLVALGAAGFGGCSSNSNNPKPDGGVDGGNDGGGGDVAGSLLPFKASNIDLSGIDLSQIADEDTTSSCQIRTSISDCFNKAAFHTAKQSDGSNLTIIVVKSWKVEPTAHVTLSTLGGNTPMAIVALGDINIMGTIDGHGSDIHAAPGGFESIMAQDGSGPGGGPKGTSAVGAGGASYCGLGGAGSVVMNSGGTPGAATAASGSPTIVPLRGGASGGGGSSSQGGGGGAGLQLVAGGAFKMAAGSYINLGGGGGGFGVTAGGGGAGGALLVEATSISVAGVIAVNGGGGGGAGAGLDSGKNGSPDAMAALGGPGKAPGGPGSAGAVVDGAAAPAPGDTGVAGGGGGGAGRIRLNSQTGAADLTSATLSPPATTPCVTQGTLK
jgi:hypothetical protein